VTLGLRDPSFPLAGRAQKAFPKVLHVIASLNIGGTERQLLQFIQRSSDPRNHVVATFDEPGELAGDLPTPVHHVGPFGRHPLSYARNVPAVMRLRRAISGLGVDLVHAHLGVSEVFTAIASPPHIPVVASRRGRNIGFERSRWLKVVEGLSHRRVDAMICNSRYLADYVREHDLFTPPIYVIYNAVDSDVFPPTPLPDFDRPTIVQVANLRPQKQQGLLLRALQMILKEVPTIRGIFVGDGPDRLLLERMAKDMGISPNVEFTGTVQDIRPYVAQSHISVLTSRDEGFPNALLESMAMGRPVLAPNVGGIPELVRDGVEGWLVQPEADSIARAILGFIRDPSVASRMGTAAVAKARQFGWERLVHETERLYLRLFTVGRGYRRRHRSEKACAG
jgi:glycosyltransferase involved in cell wall biosynthesis